MQAVGAIAIQRAGGTAAKLQCAFKSTPLVTHTVQAGGGAVQRAGGAAADLLCIRILCSAHLTRHFHYPVVSAALQAGGAALAAAGRYSKPVALLQPCHVLASTLYPM